MEWSRYFTNQEKRIQLILVVVGLVFSTSLIAFHEIEGLSWLDSSYLLIVTVSTVGFGDLIPTHPETKAISIVLIITGISSIALLSEFFINNLIKARFSERLDLPIEGLENVNHIVIGGYNGTTRMIARYFTDRFEKIVFIDHDEDLIRQARFEGSEGYTADLTSLVMLRKLNLNRSKGLFLSLPSDSDTIRTAILSRQIDRELLIYTDTNFHVSIDFGGLIGITRTYHRGRVLGGLIGYLLQELHYLSIPNQDVPGSKFHLFQVSPNFPIKEKFPEAYLLGKLYLMMNVFLNESEAREDWQKCKHAYGELDNDNFHYVLVQKIDDERPETAIDLIDTDKSHQKIVVAGYNEEIEDILSHMRTLQNFHSIKIISFSQNEVNEAQKHGYDARLCKQDNLLEMVTENLNDNDVLLNFLIDITEALLLNVIIRNAGLKTRIMQIAYEMIEIETFINSGADQVIPPDIQMSRAMSQILVTDRKELVSMPYTNVHVMEQLIDRNHPFHRRKVESLSNDNYTVALHLKASTNQIEYYPTKGILEDGDSVYMLKWHYDL
jgi:Trk K+ transport system NAD-binding subunit